jgi:hypothetical protein
MTPDELTNPEAREWPDPTKPLSIRSSWSRNDHRAPLSSESALARDKYAFDFSGAPTAVLKEVAYWRVPVKRAQRTLEPPETLRGLVSN